MVFWINGWTDGWIHQWMTEWMNGWMDGWLNKFLWLRVLQWLCVIVVSIISSSEAISSKGTAGYILAVTKVTAAYATAAVDPSLGK